MITTKLAQVFFLRVTDNSSKLQKVCGIIHDHFTKKEKILIVVSSTEAANYIDQLLWRMPEESFVPHAIANSSTKELVAITTSLLNVNQSAIVVNLSANILNLGSIEQIYELLDLTSPDKESMSRKKQSEYRASGYEVEEI